MTNQELPLTNVIKSHLLPSSTYCKDIEWGNGIFDLRQRKLKNEEEKKEKKSEEENFLPHVVVSSTDLMAGADVAVIF